MVPLVTWLHLPLVSSPASTTPPSPATNEREVRPPPLAAHRVVARHRRLLQQPLTCRVSYNQHQAAALTRTVNTIIGTDLAHEQDVSVVDAGEDTSGRCNHVTSGTIQTSAHYLTFPALQHNALIAETTHRDHEDQTHCSDTA